jgi:hypothetical protein
MATKNEELFARTGIGSLPNEVFEKDSGAYSPAVQGFAKESGNVGAQAKPNPTNPLSNLRKC